MFEQLLPNSPQQNTKESLLAPTTELGIEAYQLENEFLFFPDGDAPETGFLDGDPLEILIPEITVDFKEVKSFKDFHILVSGLVINSESVEHLRTRYYEFCCS